MKALLGILSLASLAICLASGFLFLRGSVSMDAYKNLLLAASLAYFIFATAWAARRKER